MSLYLGTTPIADGASTALLAGKANVSLNNLSNGLSNTICTTKATTSSTASSSKPAVVKQNYVNGSSWYRVWSDGWIEQGGVSTQSSGSSYSTVTFLKSFSNSNYTIVVSQQSSNSTFPNTNFAAYYNKTATTVKIGNRMTNNEAALNQSWYACGY